MSSVGPAAPKQSNGYFVPLGNCIGKVLQYSGGSGAGGSFLPGNFSVATWAAAGNASAGGPSVLVSTISAAGAGGLLKDMGKTVVSSNRTFRKVQLVAPNSLSTSGVAGAPADVNPYLTGYIELSSGFAGSAGGATNASAVAPVAYMSGLM